MKVSIGAASVRIDGEGLVANQATSKGFEMTQIASARNDYDPTMAATDASAAKQYLLSIYQPDGEPPPPELLAKVMQDVNAFLEETRVAGVWVFNGGLHPPATATVVRFQRGDALVTDGPFAEGKEHLGGFVVIRVPDLDAALHWARKLARALTLPGREAEGGLPIEVRPFVH